MARPKPDDEDRDREVDDRILSDFSTDPELAGYSHNTWALAVLFVGVVAFGLPQLLPLPVAIVGGIGVIIGIGVLFSATPPHLTPWEFAYRRITTRTRQQVYVPNGSGSKWQKHTNHTDSEGDDDE